MKNIIRKFSVAAGVAVMAALGFVASPGAAHAATTYSQLQLQNSGYCLKDPGNSTTLGTKLVIQPCDGSAGEHIAYVPNGAGGNELQFKNGLCVDDPASSTTNGTQAQVYTCNQTNAQNFDTVTYNGFTAYRLDSLLSGFSLDDYNNLRTAGNKVQFWDNTGNPDNAQQWTPPTAQPTASFELGWYPAESTSFSTSEYSGLGMTPKYVTYFSCVPGSLWAHPLNTQLISDAHAAGVGVFLKMDDRTDGSGCGVPGGLPNVANGSDNSYLKAFGTDIANLGIPITITYDWEMNGSWYDYGNGGSLGVTPSEYIQAWNNVVNQVDSTDNGLVTWAWVPNIASGASDASPYWSSNGVTVQHVGKIGVDAYLCLGQTSGSCSQTYDNNLKSGVDAIKALDPAIPTFLGETGIGGTNRETNLQTLVNQVNADGLQGLMYFNQDAEALDSSEQAALGSAVMSINGG